MAAETQTDQQSHVVIRALEQRVRDLDHQLSHEVFRQKDYEILRQYLRGRVDEARDQLTNIRIALSEPDAQS
jgi:hypothetical protein